MKKTLHKIIIVLWFAACLAVGGFAYADTAVRITGDYPHIIELRSDGAGYSLAGTLFTCDGEPFGIRGAALVLGDTTFARLSGRIRVMRASDSCYVDQFILGVHGGLLRRWVEAEGSAMIMFKGERYPMRFAMPASVRAKVAEAFGWR